MKKYQIIFSNLAIRSRRYIYKNKFFRKSVSITFRVLFLVGIFLFLLNISGLFISLRSEEIYNQKLAFPNDIQLTPKQIFEQIESVKNLPDKEYVEEINRIIHNGLVHYWGDDKKTTYHMRIPIYENYILFFLGIWQPEQYDKYEYCNYKKALERGVGFCSQHALAMEDLLKEKGIDSKVMGLDGHVIVTAQVDKENNIWWVFDPDYGVIIKHDMEEIVNNPEIIRPYYLEKFSDKTINIDKLILIYDNKNGKDAEYPCVNSETENKSYILAWLIPALLIIPQILQNIIARHKLNK